jgi:hypothetical protein
MVSGSSTACRVVAMPAELFEDVEEAEVAADWARICDQENVERPRQARCG